MKWARIIIPLILGAAAFLANWMVLNEIRKSPDVSFEFVTVKEYTSVGSEIEESMLDSIIVSGTPNMLEKLKKTAVPFSERSVLYSRQLTRTLSKSDIIFWRDITSKGELSEPVLHLSLDSMEVISPLIKVGDGIAFLIPTSTGAENSAVKYTEIGPYTVVTVGQITARPALGSTESQSENDRMITIALDNSNKSKSTYTTKDDKIIQLLDAMKRAETNSQAKIRVIQVPRNKMLERNNKSADNKFTEMFGN